ncbi:DUF5317 domain-containing protein [soil metagenome]
MILLYAVAAGLIAGLVSGGRLSALADARFRLWPVALAGLAFQVLLFSSPLTASVGSLGPTLYVVSMLAVVMALVVNLRLPGFALIVLGAALNLVAIVANGGQMPASPEAVALLSGTAVLPTTDFSNSVIAGPHTYFAFLGDIFALPRPLPLANVFSIGDVLVGVGGAWYIVRRMHERPQPAPSATGRPGRGVRTASHG